MTTSQTPPASIINSISNKINKTTSEPDSNSFEDNTNSTAFQSCLNIHDSHDSHEIHDLDNSIIAQKQHELDIAREENKLVAAHALDLLDENKNLHSQISCLNNEIHNLRVTLQNLTDDKIDAEKHLEAVKDQKNTAAMLSYERESKLNQEISNLREINSKNQTIYNQKKDNSLLLSELSHENEDLISKIDGPEGFKIQIANLEEMVKTLKSSQQESEHRESKLLKEITNLETENSEIQETLILTNDKLIEIEYLENEILSCNMKLEDNKREIDNFQELICIKDEEIKELKGDLEKEKYKIKCLEQKLIKSNGKKRNHTASTIPIKNSKNGSNYEEEKTLVNDDNRCKNSNRKSKIPQLKLDMPINVNSSIPVNTAPPAYEEALNQSPEDNFKQPFLPAKLPSTTNNHTTTTTPTTCNSEPTLNSNNNNTTNHTAIINHTSTVGTTINNKLTASSNSLHHQFTNQPFNPANNSLGSSIDNLNVCALHNNLVDSETESYTIDYEHYMHGAAANLSTSTPNHNHKPKIIFKNKKNLKYELELNRLHTVNQKLEKEQQTLKVEFENYKNLTSMKLKNANAMLEKSKDTCSKYKVIVNEFQKIKQVLELYDMNLDNFELFERELEEKLQNAGVLNLSNSLVEPTSPTKNPQNTTINNFTSLLNNKTETIKKLRYILKHQEESKKNIEMMARDNYNTMINIKTEIINKLIIELRNRRLKEKEFKRIKNEMRQRTDHWRNVLATLASEVDQKEEMLGRYRKRLDRTLNEKSKLEEMLLERKKN